MRSGSRLVRGSISKNKTQHRRQSGGRRVSHNRRYSKSIRHGNANELQVNAENQNMFPSRGGTQGDYRRERYGSVGMASRVRRNSNEARFDAHLQQEFKRAKMKKAAQAVVARELIDMSRAEREQKENGSDNFWGIDSMRISHTNAARVALRAAKDVGHLEKQLSDALSRLLSWIRIEEKRRASSIEDRQRVVKESHRAHMRAFWAHGSDTLDKCFLPTQDVRSSHSIATTPKNVTKIAARASAARKGTRRNTDKNSKVVGKQSDLNRKKKKRDRDASKHRPSRSHPSSILGSTLKDAASAIHSLQKEEYIPNIVVSKLQHSLRTSRPYFERRGYSDAGALSP